MPTKIVHGKIVKLPTILFAVLLTSTLATAQREATLHSFHVFKDGSVPAAGLISDNAGNLYGTVSHGGAFGYGAVFELSLINGIWKETTLYSFTGAEDGADPSASLTLDASGNLYGTTAYASGTNLQGGAVFELTPANGTWTLNVLHAFGNQGGDGTTPYGGVLFDRAGNLYGTTTYGGCANFGLGCGIVYELSPQSGGGWTETILHSFVPNSSDGYQPWGNLIADAKGNLYGATNAGGTGGAGTVFELSPQAGGGWTETVLYSFGFQPDARNPLSGVTLDAKGNIYGTSLLGGTNNAGAVYELSPSASGVWTEKVLYSFGSVTPDGASPKAGLILDARGNLYGTTSTGNGEPFGSIYELQPSSSGSWTEKILYSFTGKGDGAIPESGLLLLHGAFYGTASAGGLGAGGTVFKFVP